MREDTEMLLLETLKHIAIELQQIKELLQQATTTDQPNIFSNIRYKGGRR